MTVAAFILSVLAVLLAVVAMVDADDVRRGVRKFFAEYGHPDYTRKERW